LVIAVRPWVVEFVAAERVADVQWFGIGLSCAWWLIHPGPKRRLPLWLFAPSVLLAIAWLQSSPMSRNAPELFREGQGLAFGVALCVTAMLADGRRRRQLLGVLAGIGLTLSLHALWQAAVLFPALAQFPWAALAPNAELADFAAQVIARRRAFGPFPLPGLLSGALAILLPLSVATLHPWATTSRRRVLATGAWAIQATALFLTQSLGGIASLGAAGLLGLSLRHYSWRQRLALATVLVVVIGAPFALRPELARLDHPQNPIMQRWRYWQSAVQMIEDAPVRGLGGGNFALLYPRYQQPLATPTRFAHNAWLHVWAEWGLLGVVGLAGLCIGSLRLAARQPLGMHVAAWAFWLLASVDITWSVVQVAFLWWLVAGLSSTASGAAPER
jgi:hypothetical protein